MVKGCEHSGKTERSNTKADCSRRLQKVAVRRQNVAERSSMETEHSSTKVRSSETVRPLVATGQPNVVAALCCTCSVPECVDEYENEIPRVSLNPLTV